MKTHKKNTHKQQIQTKSTQPNKPATKNKRNNNIQTIKSINKHTSITQHKQTNKQKQHIKTTTQPSNQPNKQTNKQTTPNNKYNQTHKKT